MLSGDPEAGQSYSERAYEAERRLLSNIRTSVNAAEHYMDAEEWRSAIDCLHDAEASSSRLRIRLSESH